MGRKKCFFSFQQDCRSTSVVYSGVQLLGNLARDFAVGWAYIYLFLFLFFFYLQNLLKLP